MCLDSCTADADCQDVGSLPTCNTNTGACVCTADADCDAINSGDKCDVASGACYTPCGTGGDCSAAPYGGCCETDGNLSFCDPAASTGSGTTTGTTTGGTTTGTSTTGSTTSGTTGDAAGLIFSEYYEGLSNNKALEIYNGGSAAADLTGVQIRIFLNAGFSLDAGAPSGIYAFVDAGFNSLPSHGTFVICNSQFDAGPSTPTCNDHSAGANSVVNFNGNDVLLLTYADGGIVDSFGDNTDPTTSWGGTGNAVTKDNDLRRNCSVTSGRTNPFATFDPAAAGWDGFGVNALSDLGSYNCANQ